MAGSFLDNIDLGGLSAYLSGAAKNAASGNQAEGQYLNARDAIKAQLFKAQQDAATAANAQGLNNAKFSTGLPGQGASEAVRGSLIQNTQDVGMDLGNNHANVVNFTGGTRPSSFTPETRQAGADLIKHGQSLIADPGSFVPAQQSVAAPALSEEPKAGFWGQAAGAGGTITGLLSALTKGGPGGSGGGGDLTKIINWLKGLGSGPDAYSEEDSPQHHDEDTRGQGGTTSGRALDPTTGLPLPYGPDDGSGGDDGGYGYDPNQDRGPWWDDTGGGGGYDGGDAQEPGPDWGG